MSYRPVLAHVYDLLTSISSLISPARQLYDDTLVDPMRLTLPQDVVRKDQSIITEVHGAVKATLEDARTAKALGSSLQSAVYLEVEDGKAAAVLGRYMDELHDIFVVSSVQVNEPLPENPAWAFQKEFEIQDAKVNVHVLPPKQEKCSRCWRYMAPKEDALCGRCEEVVRA